MFSAHTRSYDWCVAQGREKNKNPALKSETCFGRCAKCTFICDTTAAFRIKDKKKTTAAKS